MVQQKNEDHMFWLVVVASSIVCCIGMSFGIDATVWFSLSACNQMLMLFSLTDSNLTSVSLLPSGSFDAFPTNSWC
jgi:hypothetical protein